jgi:hypothetical protein
MDWLLRQMGYANVAIWLAGPDSDFQLGAYMKYTIPGDTGLTDAMRAGIIELLRRDGLVHLDAAQAIKVLTAGELHYLRDQTVLAIHCTYLGESLASIVLFREGNKPFTDEDVSMLRAIGPVFAVALASIVRAQADEHDDDDDEDSHGGNGPMIDDPDSDSPPRRRRKRNDSDWWKRGEPPPF